MKAENIITRCLLLLGLACVAPLGSASPKWECSGHAADVETYDFAEIVIHVTDPDVANPFTDASVQGQFAHEGSEPVKVDGLCDATDGSEVRIRFMPSRLGRHAYSVDTTYPPLKSFSAHIADGVMRLRTPGGNLVVHAPRKEQESASGTAGMQTETRAVSP